MKTMSLNDDTNRQTDKPIVYQAKTAAFLSWSQPFIYRLIKGVETDVQNVIVCQRTENLDRFPVDAFETLSARILMSPTRAFMAAKRIQETHGGHVIHAHFGYSAVKVLLLKIMLRVPMVVTFGGRDLTVHAKRPETLKVYRQMFQCVEQFVAVSEDLRQTAIELGCPDEKIVTIRRGVPLEHYPFHDRSGREGQPLKMLMVSRLVAKKGYADAFHALAALPADVDWSLTCVGEGEEYSSLKALAASLKIGGRVKFTGTLESDGVLEQMHHADLFIHPSVTPECGDREGIPNALVEAQSTGLPAVATRHGGIPEVVIDGETGLLIEEHDIEALTQSIEMFARDRQMGLNMGQKASEYCQKELSITTQISRYQAIYRDLIERFPRNCKAMLRPRLSPDLPRNICIAHEETKASGDLSISELLEQYFVTANPSKKYAEPWWYSLFWRMKRFVPSKIKFQLKQVMSAIMKKIPKRPPQDPLPVDKFWVEVTESGFGPD